MPCSLLWLPKYFSYQISFYYLIEYIYHKGIFIDTKYTDWVKIWCLFLSKWIYHYVRWAKDIYGRKTIILCFNIIYKSMKWMVIRNNDPRAIHMSVNIDFLKTYLKKKKILAIKQKVIFMYDSALSHAAIVTVEYLAKLGFKLSDFQSGLHVRQIWTLSKIFGTSSKGAFMREASNFNPRIRINANCL